MLISKGHYTLGCPDWRGKPLSFHLSSLCVYDPLPFSVIPTCFSLPHKNDTQYTSEPQMPKRNKYTSSPPYIYFFYYKCFLMLFVLCYLGFDLSRFSVENWSSPVGVLARTFILVVSSFSTVRYKQPRRADPTIGAYDFWVIT